MAIQARLAAVALIAAMCILSLSLPRASANAAVSCTASGLATGLESCLSTSPDKADCCDYLINDIIYPCGVTKVCRLELASEVLDFFDYCQFKCHGLVPRLSTTS